MGGGASTELSKKASSRLREFRENLPGVAWVPLSEAASKPLCQSLFIPRYVLQLCMKKTGNIGKVDFVAPFTECSIRCRESISNQLQVQTQRSQKYCPSCSNSQNPSTNDSDTTVTLGVPHTTTIDLAHHVGRLLRTNRLPLTNFMVHTTSNLTAQTTSF